MAGVDGPRDRKTSLFLGADRRRGSGHSWESSSYRVRPRETVWTPSPFRRVLSPPPPPRPELSHPAEDTDLVHT